MAEPFYVCKVLVRELRSTLCMGKGMAQSHHAGFQLAMKYGNREEVKAYASSKCPYTGQVADNFGTTITLQAVNKYNTEMQIRNIVENARKLGFISDIVNDPSYPLPDGLIAEVVTMGYVLGPVGDPAFEMLIPKTGWELFSNERQS